MKRFLAQTARFRSFSAIFGHFRQFSAIFSHFRDIFANPPVYLFTMMKSFLARNLVFWYKLEKRLKKADVPRIFHYPQLDDEAVFCEKCDKEIYCIIFASKPVDENEVQGKHTPHCLHCALKVQIQSDEGGRNNLKRLEEIPFSQHRFSRFVVLQQYTIGDLMDTYDRFRLNY